MLTPEYTIDKLDEPMTSYTAHADSCTAAMGGDEFTVISGVERVS